MNQKVKIIDSMMGTGKTTFAIQFMNTAPNNQKFIYITLNFRSIN
jgi:KaiC/GvpD/RAD55 family RecA-like ATPase